ncbi:MAG TPA: beta galactosidase jelly roll domain-containing protein, partial [Pseudonocardiaceae bacterium]
MSGQSDRESGGVSRRRALRLGAVAAGSLTLGLDRVAAAVADSLPAESARERSFDDGWRFFRGDASGADAPSFDDTTWRSLDLPHDWSIEDLPDAPAPDGGATSDPSLLVPQQPPTQPVPPPLIGPFNPQNSPGDGSTADTIGGIGWYRKRFELDPAARHVELRFDGVYQNADFWLNGTHLGFHPYGYTSFAFDLTPFLNPAGPNVLAVRVDNSGLTSRWYSGSGIYRHTWLTMTGPVRIPLWGVGVTTPVVSERQSVARVDVSVANLGTRPSSAAVRVTVLDPRGHAVAARETAAASVAAGGTTVSSLDVPIDRAALWSPAAPNRYTARADVLLGGRVVDTVSTPFGIRSLTWNGAVGFLLNGNPVKVDGGCIHHTHGPLGAVALDRSAERQVEILKAAGFNAIR